MLDSIKAPFPDCVKTLCDNIKLDLSFKDFHKWAEENNVPVIVLSSGMVPIVRALLVHLVGPEANDIEIVANDVQDRPGKTKDQERGWEIKFHDDRCECSAKDTQTQHPTDFLLEVTSATINR